MNSPVANTNPNVGLTEADIAPYRPHHETHHTAGSLNLKFSTATGSEKFILKNANGTQAFKANLNGAADNLFGFIDFKDSVDYLFDNSLAAPQLSLNRNTTMAFEFQFALDATANNQVLGLVRNGVEFHMSPERVPAPSTAIVLLVAAGGATRRRLR